MTRTDRRPRAHHNAAYHIRREAINEALGLPAKIPLGFAKEYTLVTVRTGHWLPRWGTPRPGETGTVVLPRVRVVARGVANRVQAECPHCGAWVRVCGLQQHVGSKVCKAGEAERAKAAAAVPDPTPAQMAAFQAEADGWARANPGAAARAERAGTEPGYVSTS